MHINVNDRHFEKNLRRIMGGEGVLQKSLDRHERTFVTSLASAAASTALYLPVQNAGKEAAAPMINQTSFFRDPYIFRMFRCIYYMSNAIQ